jgi:hypothetical protein
MKKSKESEPKKSKTSEHWARLLFEIQILDSDVGYIWQIRRPQDDSDLTEDEQKIPASMSSHSTMGSWELAIEDAYRTLLRMIPHTKPAQTRPQYRPLRPRNETI